MRILPFVDIPLIEDISPTGGQRRATVKDLGREYWEVCHLAYEKGGDILDEYFFQLGFIVDGEVRTSCDVIKEVMHMAIPYADWEEYNESLPEIQNHLALYCQKVGIVPVWGTPNYEALKEEGRTPRILQGPHKQGNISKRESRYVILDSMGEFAYGPTLEYLKKLQRATIQAVGEK